jgi:Uma2 family endonuclease
MSDLLAPSPPLISPPSPNEGLPLREFMRRYAAQPFELIDGEMIPMSPQAARSSRLAFKLARLLADFIEKDGRGEVFIETPFVISSRKDWVKGSRTPDLMLVDAPRLAALNAAEPDWERGPMPLLPNIAVEILSPSDRLHRMQRKAKRYLLDGVGQVWVVDSWRGMLYLHRNEAEMLSLTEDETLRGEGLLAGLELPLLPLIGIK